MTTHPRLAHRRQRGGVAVEAAATLPILLGIALIGADMQRLHVERGRIEHTAGVLALNVAAQPALSQAGFDALARIAMQGHEAAQSITVFHIEPSGRIKWALRRGVGASCDAPATNGIWTGVWPGPAAPTGAVPEATAQGVTAAPAHSHIAVHACRYADGIAMRLLSRPASIQTQAIHPAPTAPVLLDKALRDESAATGLSHLES